ncbi:PLC-like phosphodiesterase [Schizophyllum commune Tattone D]|nr:PLC-like phosphodiesterase [Schizophyllum commune Tattone D]
MSHKLPECWGHRGASARFPENTMASFEAAIRDGVDGLESDVHVSKDHVVLMFHDPTLDRTTNQTGAIKERDWYGEGGMEHARTKKSPQQAIPTFAETLELLMKPENQHVTFNVDIKPNNDPAVLFPLLHKLIVAHDSWETLLAPRLVLGLWHPRFIPFAREILPGCRRSYLGISVSDARTYFWDNVDTISLLFASIISNGGRTFVEQMHAAGKRVMVWTVNDPDMMLEAISWEPDVIMTDKTYLLIDLKKQLAADYDKVMSSRKQLPIWRSSLAYWPLIGLGSYLIRRLRLEKLAGPFDGSLETPVPPEIIPGKSEKPLEEVLPERDALADNPLANETIPSNAVLSAASG